MARQVDLQVRLGLTRVADTVEERLMAKFRQLSAETKDISQPNNFVIVGRVLSHYAINHSTCNTRKYKENLRNSGVLKGCYTYRPGSTKRRTWKLTTYHLEPTIYFPPSIDNQLILTGCAQTATVGDPMVVGLLFFLSS